MKLFMHKFYSKLSKVGYFADGSHSPYLEIGTTLLQKIRLLVQ
jgi:hypothetical protein